MNIIVDKFKIIEFVSQNKDTRLKIPLNYEEQLRTRETNEVKEFEFVGMQTYSIEGLALLNDEVQDLTVIEFYGISHANNVDGKYQGSKKRHEKLEVDAKLTIYSEYVIYFNEELNKAIDNNIETFNIMEFIASNEIPVVDVEIGYN